MSPDLSHVHNVNFNREAYNQNLSGYNSSTESRLMSKTGLNTDEQEESAKSSSLKAKKTRIMSGLSLPKLIRKKSV